METEFDYKVLVAFENLPLGREFRAAPTVRLSALTAAGYLAVRTVEVGPWRAAEMGAAALEAIADGEAEGIPTGRRPAKKTTGK